MESGSIFNVCRLCLYKSERLINIFEVNGRHGYVAAEVITDLLQFKVCRTDGYPHFVCCTCLDKLTDFKIFKDQCVNSKITYDNEFSMKKGDQYYPDSVGHAKVKKDQEEDDTKKVNFVPVRIKREVETDEDDSDSQMIAGKGAEDLSVSRGAGEEDSEICDKPIKMEDEDESDSPETESDEGTRQDLPMREDMEGERIEVCPEVGHLTGQLDDVDPKSDMTVMDLRKPRIGGDDSEQTFDRPNSYRNESDESYVPGNHRPQKNSYCVENLSGKSNDPSPLQQHHGRRGGEGETSTEQGNSQDEFYKRERPYECEECGWRFVNTTQLDKHMQIHSTDKPFECEECGWRFFNRGQLTRHQKSHNGEKPFICEVCGKRFVRKSSLVTHHRIHTGEKPFSCEECGSSFAQSGDLAKHMRIHSGEKPFPCHECGKMFAQSSDLAKHFRVHSGEKPYACDECERRFASTCDLNRHKMGHRGDKPFECELCEKRFIRRSALVIHVRTHTGEKPYSCPECGKGFPQRSGLATHLRVHSGERPYPCSECDKRFNTSGDLKRHMNVHTK